MPISRDPRNDRRRRVLRDSFDQDTPPSKRRRRKAEDEDDLPHQGRRDAGYSQDVRRACGVRLVQLIPVRHASYVAAIVASILVPAILLIFHYMIYVSGSLQWYGHPLAVSLDASHQNSIATWLSSHVWLLCLGATVLTFQLRRHKLDDYDGEYRLWFWIVITCLAASVDATTHISKLFGLALTPWSQVNLGWSGPAVVKATLAVLIGLLGLRLCSELKSVPASLAFWLFGLVAWAGSAALAQEELRIDEETMSLQFRIWMKAALWLGGLTAIWLSALTYLRHVYIVAQKRFLARGRFRNRNTVPLRQRIRDSLPRFEREERDEEERERRGWMPGFLQNRRDADEDEEQGPGETARERRKREREEKAQLRAMEREEKLRRKQEQQEARRSQTEVLEEESDDEDAPSKRRLGWGRFFNRTGADGTEDQAEEETTQSRRTRRRRTDAENESSEDAPRRGMFSGWLKRPKDDDDAEEYQKVRRESERSRRNTQDDDEEEEAESKRSWFSRRRRTEAADEVEDDRADSEQKKRKGFFSRFTLQPPEEGEESGEQSEVDRDNLPSTDSYSSDPEPDEPQRPLTKAERKRLRRQQRQNRAA